MAASAVRRLVRGINPRAKLLRMGTPSVVEQEDQENQRPSQQRRPQQLGDAGERAVDAAGALLSAVSAAAGNAMEEAADDEHDDDDDDDDDDEKVLIRRGVFRASRPFHPPRLSQCVIEQVNRQNGTSAFGCLLESGFRDAASCWERVVYLAQDDCWMASQPDLSFRLRFSGCLFRLDEVQPPQPPPQPQPQANSAATAELEEAVQVGAGTGAGGAGTGAAALPSPPASSSPSVPPSPQQQPLQPLQQQQRMQELVVVVAGTAAHLRSCLVDLEACALNDHEMEDYARRVDAKRARSG